MNYVPSIHTLSRITTAVLETDKKTTFFSQNHNYITNDYGQAVDWMPQPIPELTNQIIERGSFSTCRLKTVSLGYRQLRTLWEIQKT